MHYELREQDIYDFASSRRISVKDRGKEVQFTYCPYCHGGSQRKDKGTFSINRETGQFKCMRATCGVTGNMVTLARDFDFKLTDDFSNYYRKRPSFKKLQQPKAEIIPKPPAVEYLKKRGISEETAKQYQVTVKTNDDTVMVFPIIDENGKLVNIKFRNLRYTEDKKNGGKEWFEPGCVPYIYGLQSWNGNYDRMVLCEGQIDALSCYESGIENSFSVPSGAKGFTWWPPSYEFVVKFEEMIIFGDFENGKITLLDEMKQRYGGNIRFVKPEDYKDCKDANEILMKYGKEQVRYCVEHASIVPIADVIELSDVEDVDIAKIEKLPTGIKQVDGLLYGGLPFGGVNLIAGKPGSGKLLADDTPVFTSEGWKRHGDLKVGDEVVGRHGKFVKVTHVFPKYFANMKVTFNNGDVIKCHENHEWVTDIHFGNGYRERIQTAKEIHEWLSHDHYHPARLISREPLDGNDVELKVSPYTLGAWLGDGRNQNPDIASSEMDYCVIERILQDGYEISWQTVHKTTGVIYTGIKGLRAGLRFYGMCHSKKALPKRIPTDYLVAKLKDRLELLAGLLDTDGCYCSEKHCYTYSTTGKELRDSFIDLIHTFGWNCWVTRSEATKSSSGIVGRKDVYVVGFVPIGLEIPCAVKRKRQDIIKPYSKRRNAISSIEYCEEVPGNCIEVEGGIYCVGKTMIPTHNSTLSSQILVMAISIGYKCFVYSGELPNFMFKGWINYQIAGGKHVFQTGDGVHENFGYSISKANRNVISEWYRGKAFIYDNSSIDSNEHIGLIEAVEKAIQRYGCRVILIDNLMTALDMETLSGDDKYDRQSHFVKKLTRVALRYNVMVLLVAHKRKNNATIDANDEISGSGDIANLGMVTLSYDKNPKEPEGEPPRIIRVSKNRLFGRIDNKGFKVNFDERSKRIFGEGDDPDIEYGCFNDSEDGFVPISTDDDVVFD